MSGNGFAESANEVLACIANGATFMECFPLLRELESKREIELGELPWPGCKVWLENGDIAVATAHPTLDDFRDARFDASKQLTEFENAELCEHVSKTIKAWLRELARRASAKRDAPWYSAEFNLLAERFLRASSSRLFRDAKQAGGLLVANAVRDGVFDVRKPLRDECELLSNIGIHEGVRKPWLPAWIFEHAAIAYGNCVNASVFPRRACIDHTKEPGWKSQKEASIVFCRLMSERFEKAEIPLVHFAPVVTSDMNNFEAFVSIGDCLTTIRFNMRKSSEWAKVCGKDNWEVTNAFHDVSAGVINDLRTRGGDTTSIHRVVHAARFISYLEKDFDEQWLIVKPQLLAISETGTSPSGPKDDLQKEIRADALAAVVAGGFPGITQAAVSVPAGDRITAVMRSMCSNDKKYYLWSANDWVEHLKASKPTVTGCDAWKEIMAWRESHKELAMPVRSATQKAESRRRIQRKKLVE